MFICNVKVNWDVDVEVISQNRPRPNCHGNESRAIHPQALLKEMPLGTALLLIEDCATAVFCLAGLVDE